MSPILRYTQETNDDADGTDMISHTTLGITTIHFQLRAQLPHSIVSTQQISRESPKQRFSRGLTTELAYFGTQLPSTDIVSEGHHVPDREGNDEYVNARETESDLG